MLVNFALSKFVITSAINNTKLTNAFTLHQVHQVHECQVCKLLMGYPGHHGLLGFLYCVFVCHLLRIIFALWATYCGPLFALCSINRGQIFAFCAIYCGPLWIISCLVMRTTNLRPFGVVKMFNTPSSAHTCWVNNARIFNKTKYND